MSLKNRLLCFFLIISVLPVLLLGTVSYSISYRIMKDGEITKQLHELERIQDATRELMYQFQHIGIRFIMNRELQTMLLSEDRSYSGLTRFEFEIKKLLHDYRNTGGTVSSGLFFRDGLSFVNRPEKCLAFNAYAAEPWFVDAMERERSYFWGDPMSVGNELAVPLVRILPSFVDQTKNAVLVINVKESSLAQVREEKGSLPGVIDFVMNERGIILSHTRTSFVGLSLEAAYGVRPPSPQDENGSFESRLKDGMGLFVFTRDPKTSWVYFRLIPLALLMRSIRYIPNSTIAFSVGCLFIGFILSLILAQQILSPVKRLIETVRKREEGLVRIDYRPGGTDEISFLNDSFEAIMRQLASAIEETLSVQREKREAELRMLEYQINPHFLYNTLSTIVWLANAKRFEDVIQVTDALSEFLRISMSKGKEFIPVRDEMRHIERFIDIEKKRYPQKFSFMSFMEPEAASCYTVKLILQPLVENAIQHGIAMRRDNKGLILVKSMSEGDSVLFEVRDNGPESVQNIIPNIRSILEHERGEDGERGIGLLNVHRRIRLHYGSAYGVDIKREEGMTVVSLRIPKITDHA
jgi:two-component system sensor histidine kinase YesM